MTDREILEHEYREAVGWYADRCRDVHSAAKGAETRIRALEKNGVTFAGINAALDSGRYASAQAQLLREDARAVYDLGCALLKAQNGGRLEAEDDKEGQA